MSSRGAFGCAGHGKGVWDGIGGLFKRVLRQDTIDGSIFSSSGAVPIRYLSVALMVVLLAGSIRNPHDVAEHLRERFSTEQWQEEHKGLNINQVIACTRSES